MSSKIVLKVFWLLFLSYASFADEEPYEDAKQVLEDEMDKARQDFQERISRENIILRDLQKKEKMVIQKTKALAQKEKKGIAILKKYITLLEVRYTDDKGEFLSKAQIKKEDVANINKLFITYLKKKAVNSTINAQKAISIIEDGIEKLEDQAEQHEQPDASNNSELELISMKREKAQKRKTVVLELVEKLGIKDVKPNVILTKPRTSKKP